MWVGNSWAMKFNTSRSGGGLSGRLTTECRGYEPNKEWSMMCSLSYLLRV